MQEVKGISCVTSAASDQRLGEGEDDSLKMVALFGHVCKNSYFCNTI